jgi:hypothetical protein
MNSGFDYVPSWAYSWCYIFAVVGCISLVKPLIALTFRKSLGVTLFVIIVLEALVQAATMFTLFWMCRSSLRGQRNLVV